MANPQIDLATLTTLIKLVTPAVVAPVAPLAPLAISDFNKGSEGAFGMAKDIAYLTKTLDEVKSELKKITETHITSQEFNEHIRISDKLHSDSETRLRAVELSQSRIMIWGSVVLGVLTTAQIILKIMGK